MFIFWLLVAELISTKKCTLSVLSIRDHIIPKV